MHHKFNKSDQMKNKLKTLTLIILSAGVTLISGCTEEKPIIDNPPVEGTIYHSGFISENQTWTASSIHVLQNRVIVQPGVTLKIEPGTIIKGEAGQEANASALIIARGAKINAQGTIDNPIIFTSVADEIALGQKFGTNLSTTKTKGFWGGLIILGDAPISPKTGTTEQIEGVPADVIEGNYGGSNPADNSGVLTYVSIRFGGTLIGEGNEINGLTLGGVGSGTKIDHIEVIGTMDDGIEFFGGSVNVTNALVAFQGDDGFDVDQAYTGILSNFIYLGGADSDHALEIDGPEGSENSEGAFIFRNGSLMGNAKIGEYVDFRSNAQGTVENCYFFGFNANADIELDDEKSSTNFINGELSFNNNSFNSSVWSLDSEGNPDGNITILSNLKSLFADKSGTSSSSAVDKFLSSNNTLVTAKANGADKNEFVGWTLADYEELLTEL